MRMADPLDAPPLERRGGTVQGRPATWWEAGPSGGPPVLLLHGSGIDEARLSWWPVAALLAARGARVLAPDLPGYGGTRGMGRAAGVPEMVRWVRAFRAAAGAPPAVTAGLSMGGAIAIGLALAEPEAVTHLVPVASYGVSASMPRHRLRRLIASMPGQALGYAAIASSPFLARRILCRVTTRRGAVDGALVAAFRRAARRQVGTPALQGFVAREVLGGGFASDFAARLGEIDCPITFVHGSGDPLIRPEDVRRAAVPPARLVELDCGHWPPREAPDEVAAVLGDALGLRVAA